MEAQGVHFYGVGVLAFSVGDVAGLAEFGYLGAAFGEDGNGWRRRRRIESKERAVEGV